ncbi:MAG: hypothetical protein V3V73_05995 [Gammaproteobacteria bacterium]
MQEVTVWQVLVGILIPVYLGGFLLLWNRQNSVVEVFQKEMLTIKADQNEIWKHVNLATQKLLEAKLESEKHFVRRDSLNDIKRDIIKHIDSWGNQLKDRVIRAEGEIDRLKANGDG